MKRWQLDNCTEMQHISTLDGLSDGKTKKRNQDDSNYSLKKKTCPFCILILKNNIFDEEF